MTTQEGMDNYLAAYQSLEASQASKRQPMPVNEQSDEQDVTVLLRKLDCAVFNILHILRASQNLVPIQALKAAFYQGAKLVPTSEFQRDTHMQIALRDPGCVLGWFLTPGAALLSESDLAIADSEMAAAVTARSSIKKRIRAA